MSLLRGPPGRLKVTVLLFASYRELVGVESLAVSLPQPTTVGTLLAELRRRGGGWARLPTAPAVAVNRSYSRNATELADGDEVALIPPVAGG